MSYHAHGTQHSRSHATRTPLAYVRVVQAKRRPPGWLECSADEFMRLLALHNAGQIDLLKMPEYSTDAEDDDAPESETEPEETPRKQSISPQNALTRGGTTVLVRNCLARSAEPLSVETIAQRTGRGYNAVRAALRRNPQWFTCADMNGRAQLWAINREGGNGVS